MQQEFQKESIVICQSAGNELAQWLNKNEYSSLYILCDKNTKEYCLPALLACIPFSTIICIEPGEKHKTLETVSQVWQQLSKKADRKSILINLGGGIITDLGGFAASCFKRGIRFVNIPTSLLAMVDAAIGGKTGVDMNSLKNEIGTFNFAENTIIDPQFLKTLPSQELRAGFAEMIKHGLIADLAYFNQLKNLDYNQLSIDEWTKLIADSVKIKSAFVLADPFENNIRAALNYGHTIAHAIESAVLATKNREALLHGEAVAAGMMMEAFLSHHFSGMKIEELSTISTYIRSIYPSLIFDETLLIEKIRFDKKNINGEIRFSLLKKIGEPVIHVNCTLEKITESISWYRKEYQQ